MSISTLPKSDPPSDAPMTRAAGLVRRLLWIYVPSAAVLIAFSAPALVPIHRAKGLGGFAAELATGGLGASALSAVLLSLTALVAIGIVAFARLARRQAEAMSLGELGSPPPGWFRRMSHREPGFLAREGQAAILTAGAIIIALLSWRMWPSAYPTPVIGSDANLVAALVIGLAFPSLIAERMVSGIPSEQLPEAPSLRRLLLLTTLVLACAGVLEIGRSVGFGWVFWGQRALIVLLLLLAFELALRGLGRLFLPPPVEDIRAVSQSVVAALATGGPRAPGLLIRTHLGLDFERSWALSYLNAAAMPALVCTLLFCWMLSGVKLLDGDQRGVYERLGAPVAVLGPGFHLLLPWPLGRLRAVENGTIHTIAVGAAQGPNAVEKDALREQVGAEDTPIASMNRLWDTAHATEAEYLVADEAAGQQSFQAVNAEILVLYRTGLTDAAALRSVYGSADQAAIVEQEADRLATRYFSSHTLDGVMGGQRERLQEALRAALARAVDADRAGVEIVAVLIDAIHPPAGAAAAYHAVQAAEINADASVATATAHAIRAAGQSQQEAHQAVTAAQAVSIEKIQAAGGDAYQFGADRAAYRAAPPAFLQERRARNLIVALKGARLTIIDHRLRPDQIPFIDMRGGAGPAAQAAATPIPSAGDSEAIVAGEPATSTEPPSDAASSNTPRER